MAASRKSSSSLIKPAKNYPPDWESGAMQRQINERAGWRCEHCGMVFPAGSTKALTARRRNGQPMVLTVHHLDGDTQNCDYSNLLSCCQACHLHIQAVWKPGKTLPLAWDGIPDWIIKRGLPYKVNPQLKLF